MPTPPEIRKKNRPLLIVCTVLMIAVGVLLSFFVGFSASASSAEGRARVILTDSAAAQLHTITAVLRGQYHYLDSIAATLTADCGDDQSMITARLAELRNTSDFTTIRYISADGIMYYPDGSLNVSARDYAQKALHGINSLEYASQLTDDSAFIALGVPYYANGHINGAICGLYLTEDFFDLLVSEAYGGLAYTSIVDARGNIIVGEAKGGFPSGSTLQAALSGASFGDDFSFAALESDMQARKSGAFTYASGENENVAVYTPLVEIGLPLNNWYIISAVSTGAFRHEVRTERGNAIKQTLIFVLFGLLAIALIAIEQRKRNRQLIAQTEKARLREEQFRIAVKHSERNVFLYDIPTKTYIRQYINDSNLSDNAQIIQNVAQTTIESGYIAEDSIEEYRAFFHKIETGMSPVSADIHLSEKGAQNRWYRYNATTQFADDGTPQSAVVSYFDCTELRQRELAYSKWQTELADMPVDKTVLYEWNLTKDIFEGENGELVIAFKDVDANTFDARTEAYASHKVYQEDRAAYIALLRRERLIGCYYNNVFRDSMDYREVRKDGNYCWMRLSVQMVPYPDSNDIKVYLSIQDIDAEKRKELALVARSELDQLTGILNRDTFIDRLEAKIAQHPHKSHAVLMLDIDSFKLVNDVLGHDTGDEVLRDYARIMQGALRTADLVSRIGGDEFMICLHDVSFDAAIEKKAARLCTLLRKRLSDQISISASIGIAVYPRDGVSFDALYKNADTALYHAKRQGKDRYSFYRTDLEQDMPLSPSAIAAEEMPAQGVRGKKQTVMLCGGAGHCDTLLRILEKKYHVLRTHNWQETLSIYGRSRDSVSLVLLDADSDFALDALETCFSKADYWQTPVLAVSSRHDEAFHKRVLSAGAVSVAVLPMEDWELCSKVDIIIRIKDTAFSTMQRSYQRMQQSDEERYRAIMNATGTALFLYEPESRSYTVDPLMSKIIAGRFDGRYLRDVFADDGVMQPQDVDKAAACIQRLVDVESGTENMTALCLAPNGERRWIRFSFLKLKSTDEIRSKLLILVHDVHKRISAEQELLSLVEHDPLTGLYNRDAFFARAQEMIQAQEPGYYVLTCFDIDSFKYINDQFGTDIGDQVLNTLAEAVQSGFSQIGGIGCRVFADNFAAIYPRSADRDSYMLDFADTPMQKITRQYALTYSVGRCIVNDLTLPVSAIYDRAILAKRLVKGRYDRRIAYFDESMRETLLQERRITEDMESGLQAGQFKIWFQPQYNHATKALIGAEALVRWQHPEQGLLLPESFIYLFEQNGFIYTMDQYVWEQSCRFLQERMQAQEDVLPIAVNVSRYDIFQEDFFDVITGLVQQYEIPVNLLRLEITESAFVRSTDEIIHMVRRLRQHGFLIEIDDFGSGYSSLNLLKDVPADILKLDMRFLETGENTRRGGNILESVIRMASWLNMPVIAEGVESALQADYLGSVGCDYVQGYLYAKPMCEADYKALLEHSLTEQSFQVLESIEDWDNNAFWDPSSMETLVFNTFVGGACVFEYFNGRCEMLRVNRQCAQILAPGMTEQDALNLDISVYQDEENRKRVMDNIHRAIETGEPSTCQIEWGTPGDEAGIRYLKASVRVIAKAGERYLFYCLMENITSQRLAEMEVQESARQLQFLNDTARELLNKSDSGAAIEQILQKTLDYFQADRAYVFEHLPTDDCICNTYEVCREGVSAEIAQLQSVPLADIPFWRDAFQFERYVEIKDVSALPDSRGEERRILQQQNIHSLIAVPVIRKGAPTAFIGVDNPRVNAAHTKQLAALGDYLGVLLERRDITLKQIKNLMSK